MLNVPAGVSLPSAAAGNASRIVSSVRIIDRDSLALSEKQPRASVGRQGPVFDGRGLPLFLLPGGNAESADTATSSRPGRRPRRSGIIIFKDGGSHWPRSLICRGRILRQISIYKGKMPGIIMNTERYPHYCRNHRDAEAQSQTFRRLTQIMTFN